uniref:Uncharacterized protein n=1 Tax=Anguilla anguilla TaxID=7936 RepID=A0A0E9U9V9_ANGAN
MIVYWRKSFWSPSSPGIYLCRQINPSTFQKTQFFTGSFL